MNIIIKNRFLLYKGYKLKCSIGKSGLTKSKREGDLATPKGDFVLGKLYYRKDRIKALKCKSFRRPIGPRASAIEISTFCFLNTSTKTTAGATT